MSITADEIATQPQVWSRALEMVDKSTTSLAAEGESVLVIGCGTSAFAAESFARLRENAGLGVTDAAYASEPRQWRNWSTVVAISRSGTTSEVIEALSKVPAGVRKVAVTGVADAPVAQLADDVVLLDFADERSVVQTRFPTTFLLLARACFGEQVESVVAAAKAALASPLPHSAARFDHFVFLGTDWGYGLAQEAALKVRETSQAWAEAYPLLDYRHGPLAVSRPGSLVWMLGVHDNNLANDIRATGAQVVLGGADPLVDLIQAQRLAVELSESRGLNPDSPQHLTRSIILN